MRSPPDGNKDGYEGSDQQGNDHNCPSSSDCRKQYNNACALFDIEENISVGTNYVNQIHL